jgi:hypothetical protein
MGLTKAQATIWQKVRSLGSGGQAVRLSDPVYCYLIAVIVHDLKLQASFPEFAKPPSPFFSNQPLVELSIDGLDAKCLFERLVAVVDDADTYFACLAALHKARLKYERILSTQPMPTLEQVGPRGLLQYGKLKAGALAGFLFWRKWFFDIDNRAGQETGYLFEPIIAHAIGGTPAPARKSPVKRRNDATKGRQVDCLVDDSAYEFKIRVTIAASGQGRWQEELDFPLDCRASGFTPILVCMDSTANPKLDALIKAFEVHGGKVYIGDAAWNHLDDVAGKTMAVFLDKYVKAPIKDVLAQADDQLPNLIAESSATYINITIGNDTLRIDRKEGIDDIEEIDDMPDDAAEEIVD